MYAPQAYIAFLFFPPLPPVAVGHGCTSPRRPWPESSHYGMGAAAQLWLRPQAGQRRSSQGQLLLAVISPQNVLLCLNSAWRCAWEPGCAALSRRGRGFGAWVSWQGWGRAGAAPWPWSGYCQRNLPLLRVLLGQQEPADIPQLVQFLQVSTVIPQSTSGWEKM